MIHILKTFTFLLLITCVQAADAAWTKQNSNTLAWLKDVYFLSEKSGWIAGSDGTLLETGDGGKTWRQAKKFTDDTIRQVYFADARDGWLLCERNRFVRGTKMPTYALHTTDGGGTWENVEFAETGREFVTKIIFDKYGNGTAFGEGGAFFTLENDRKTWKKSVKPIKYLMLDGVFNADTNAVIVGAGGTILTSEDSGTSWNQANIYGDKSAKLNSVFFANPQNGWTVGANGVIYQTVGGGKTWREQKSGISTDLNDIFFISTAEGWTVGDEGKILHTQTAGNIWVAEDSKTTHRLEKVFFNGKKGWAVGFGGTILNYN